jgi:hypothetical protein
MSENEQGDVRIEIEPFGPGPAVNDEVSEAVLDHHSVQGYLDGTRHRLINVRLLDSEVEGKPEQPVPPDRYRATIYDYTNNRAVVATGRLDDVRGSMEVSVSGRQPLPTRDEFDEAVEVLLEDEDLGPAIEEQRLVPYRPMPPLVDEKSELPDGRVERTLAVGLMPRGHGARHEIVGANMVRRTVSRFEEGAPALARAHAHTCGVDNANQTPTPRGLAGQFQVNTTASDGSPLWSFLVVRPSASQGTNASGVELRNVRYRGKLVLFEAHAPILNVSTTGTSAVLSGTGCSRRALSRRRYNVAPGSAAPRRQRRPSSSPGRTRELPGHRDIPRGRRRSSSASCRRAGTVM